MKKKQTPLRIAAGILLLILLGLGGKLTRTTNSVASQTAIHFIDVGQGDAALFVSGSEAVLIDGGSASATDTVTDYLKQQNIHQLKAVVATHPHEDHIGSLAAVLKTFPTETLYLPNKVATTKCYEKMLDAAEDTKAAVVVPQPQDKLTLESGAALTFLSPSSDDAWSDTNDWSIVCRIDAGERSVLMTGDAGIPVEKALLAAHADLQSSILKLGHHGSSTASSRAFLKAVNPDLAIISCAKENDYGHPHKETLASLKALSIPFQATMDDRTIVIPLVLKDEAAA